jgi:hypothetical protein
MAQVLRPLIEPGRDKRPWQRPGKGTCFTPYRFIGSGPKHPAHYNFMLMESEVIMEVNQEKHRD